MSKLSDLGKIYRSENMSRNPYKDPAPYNQSNPNAISDGDEKGRGENNGQVGTATDITERNISVARNQYVFTKPYSISSIGD